MSPWTVARWASDSVFGAAVLGALFAFVMLTFCMYAVLLMQNVVHEQLEN